MNFKIIKGAKISLKITVMYAFMFSLVLLILDASILYGIKYYFYNQANKQIEDIKLIISNEVINENNNINLSDKGILDNLPYQEDISIGILRENGEILNLSNRFEHNITIKEPYDKMIHLEGKDKDLIYTNIKVASKEYGNIYLQIVKDMDNEYELMRILFGFMAVADFIGIIASIVMGYIVSKKMLTPIDYITRTAENISINNLKERIEVKGPDDELKRLGNTFNKMIDRLQGAFNSQIQFVSDASHELRTPIAVIQGYANLLDRWGKDDREALEKSIYGIKLEADNMANLVEKLLFLAKGDSGKQEIEKREFWLNSLISDVVEESKLIDKNHIISNNSNDDVKVFADYKMIKQMLRIFIDNSMKFTPENGKIIISTELHNEIVKIIVSDTGIGIPKGEFENIFHRFYIVDESRFREKGGTGLGLSIAKWIVDVHQGIIDVESEEEEGTRIIITLPIIK